MPSIPFHLKKKNLDVNFAADDIAISVETLPTNDNDSNNIRLAQTLQYHYIIVAKRAAVFWTEESNR